MPFSLGESQTIIVDVLRSDLAIGTHQGQLTFIGPGIEISVEVRVTVQAEPSLGLSDTEVAVDEASESVIFQVLNSGTGTLNWVLRETAEWLSLDQTEGAAGTLPSSIVASVSREGLVVGDYTATVSVTSDGGDATIQVVMSVALPEVYFTSGPDASQATTTDSALWELGASNTFGDEEFSTRLDSGPWSDWSSEDAVSYGGMEESSLFGDHTIEARVQTAAGVSAVESRTFAVDAIQGPAMRILPLRSHVAVGDNLEIYVVVEEVIGVLGGNILLTFDPTTVDVTEAVILRGDGSFLANLGATVISATPTIGTGGQIEAGFAAPGLERGLSGTGAILRVRLTVRSTTVVRFGTQSILRDLSNRDIPLRFRGAEIFAN